MRDNERREKLAEYAFEQLLQTEEWKYTPESVLINLHAQCRKLAGCKDPVVRKLICGAKSPGDDEDPPITCTREPHIKGKHQGGCRGGTLTWIDENKWHE